MKKRTVLTVLLALAAFGAVYAQTTVQRSLYVSAQGDDNNNGRSETTPYKTLGKAVEAANAGIIKTITIIGTISGGNARQSGADEILITGKPDASAAERAVISGYVSVDGKVRFTHIRFAKGIGNYSSTTITLGMGCVVTNPDGVGVEGVNMLIMTDDAAITGCRRSGLETRNSNITMSGNAEIIYNGIMGINSDGSTVVSMSGNAKIYGNKSVGVRCTTLTMSGNAKISDNKSEGVSCTTLTMSEDAEISGNTNTSGDGGGARVSTLTMSGNAKIINNTTKGNGGGIYINGNNNSTISGNALISGNSAKNGGGIYFGGYNSSSTLVMEGGEISNNKAEYGAGIYVEKSTFNHKGGTVTSNAAEYVGGGVYVKSGGTYTAGGGKVNGNTAGDGGEDLFRQ